MKNAKIYRSIISDLEYLVIYNLKTFKIKSLSELLVVFTNLEMSKKQHAKQLREDIYTQTIEVLLEKPDLDVEAAYSICRSINTKLE